MTEHVYMVEQIETHHQRMLSAHATIRLAEQAVEKLIAKMPSPDIWHIDSKVKRNSPNHGDTLRMWITKTVGPSSRQVCQFSVVRFAVNQGEVVERLADVVP